MTALIALFTEVVKFATAAVVLLGALAMLPLTASKQPAAPPPPQIAAQAFPAQEGGQICLVEPGLLGR